MQPLRNTFLVMAAVLKLYGWLFLLLGVLALMAGMIRSSFRYDIPIRDIFAISLSNLHLLPTGLSVLLSIFIVLCAIYALFYNDDIADRSFEQVCDHIRSQMRR